MTKNEITSIALKLFAIYLVVNILSALPTALWVQTMAAGMLEKIGEESGGLLLAWTVGGGVIIVGIVLAIFLWRLANSLIDTDEPEEFARPSSASLSEIELLVISGIGLFFVVDSIPSVGYAAIGIFESAPAKYREGANIAAVVRTIVSLFQLLIGISLLLLPRWWASIFRRTRHKLSSNKSSNRTQ